MNIEKVLERIYTKTYYIGESLKESNVPASHIQACPDDNDVLTDYINAEMTFVEAYLHKRLDFVSLSDALDACSKREKGEEMAALLERSLEEYLAESAVYRLMCDRMPSAADPRGAQDALERLKDIACSLAPTVRRRATTMGL